MKRSFIAFASILAIVAGCAKNDPQGNVAGTKITATIENEVTKATLSYAGSTGENYLVWQEGDKISLFDGTSNIECTLSSEAGSKFGEFTTASDPASVATYYAVYPYSTVNALDAGVLTVDYSNSITYKTETGSADRNALMVAEQNGTDIKFKNLCSYLRFTVTGSDTQLLKQIVIEGKGGQAIAGKATVAFAEGVPSVTAFDPEDNQAEMKVSFGDGLALSDAGVSFCVAVAPVFAEGFKVTVCLTDGSCQELTTNTAIARNEIVNMPVFAFSGKDVAEVGGTQYKSLAQAVEVANASASDVTVTMLSNAFAFDTVIVRNTASNKVTLDLNGKTVNANIKGYTDLEITDSGEGGAIKAGSTTVSMGSDAEPTAATLTLNGGTIEATSGNYAVWACGSKTVKPNFLVKKGTILANKGSLTRIKYATAQFGDETEGDITTSSLNGIWTSSGTEVTINKGTYHGTAKILYFGDNTITLTVNGGTFTSDEALFTYYKSTNNPTVAITDGYFTWDSSSAFVQAAHTKVSVSGGYFTGSVAGYEETGYICQESSAVPGYSYTVVVNEDKSIIQVGSTKYEELEPAITAANAATSATTIKLIQDIEIDNSVVFTNTAAALTLDLNGHKLSSTNVNNSPTVQIDQEGVNLTIVDSSEGANGAIDQAYDGTAYAIAIYSGTLNIESGTIRNSTGTGYGRIAIRVADTLTLAAPVVNINGGYIWGGRAMQIGGGTQIPVVNITGGLIEAIYSVSGDKTYQYGTLAFTEETYNVTMTGGVLLANTGPCFYTSKKGENCTLTFGDKDDPSKIPYLWTKSGDWCFRAGSKDASGRVFVYNAYCNNITLKYAELFNTTGATSHDLSPVVKDTYGHEYQYHVYPNPVE